MVPSDRTRAKEGHKVKSRKFCLNIKMPSYCEDGRTLEQVAQRTVGVSVLRDTQNLGRCSPRKPLGLRRGVDWAAPEAAFTFNDAIVKSIKKIWMYLALILGTDSLPSRQSMQLKKIGSFTAFTESS